MHAHFPDIGVRELRKLGVHGIEPEYVAAMREHFPDITAKDIVKFGIHDLDPAYVAGMRAEFPDITTKDIVKFGIHDITPDYVKTTRAALAERGYDDLAVKDVVRMHIHDFDPAYIDELHALGFEDLPVRTLVRMWAYTIDRAYIEAARTEQPDITPQALIDMRRDERRTFERHTERFYSAMQELGFRKISSGQLMDMLALGIDTAYVKAAREEDPDITLHGIITKRRQEQHD